MFKNLQLFKIIQANIPHDFSESLEARGFVPCGSTQEKSVGWVPPRGNEHDEFAPVIGGHTILKLTTEVKSVPSDVLQRKIDEQVSHIEQTTGRKPGKKERREIKEDAKLALLPMAFSKRSSTLIWVNPFDGYLAIDASSHCKGAIMSQDKYEIVKMARVQAVAEWQGSADGGKSWRRIDKPRGESIESRVAYLRNMTNSQGRPIYLIRALYTTPQPAAQEPTSAVPVVEPVAWSHGCNALCANIDLWISSCPHCGKPRPAAPVPQEQT